MSRPAMLFHGGVPGLRIGDRILPPSVTGFEHTILKLTLEEGIGNIAQDPELVYMTSDRNLGRAWASIYTADGATATGGALYVVDPDEPFELDRDLLSLGISWQAPAATVRAVYDAHVPYDKKHVRVLDRVLAQHAAAVKRGLHR